jgi:hypothetical protein
MPWLDPARIDEPAEDRVLRDELRSMLAIGEMPVPNASPTPNSIALAEDLRREALRRKHTPERIQRFRPNWMLVAASLPLALAVLGVGAWGYQQKAKAESLAAAVAQQEAVIQRIERTHQEAINRERARQNEALQAQVKRPSPKHGAGPKELVIPAEDRVKMIAPPDVQHVSDRK